MLGESRDRENGILMVRLQNVVLPYEETIVAKQNLYTKCRKMIKKINGITSYL